MSDRLGRGSGICVVVQFLPWVSDIWTFWVDLAALLEQQRQTLVILSPFEAPKGASWPRVVPIPFSLGHYAADAHAYAERDPAWDGLVAIDPGYRTPTHPRSRTTDVYALASAQAVIRALFDELNPDVVMAWAPPFPQSRMIIWEAQRRGIPAFGVETGFLPRTLAVERQDVGYGADLVTLPALASALASHAPDRRLVEDMRRYHSEVTHVRPQSSAAADRAPVVGLLGSCPGFNLTPRESRQLRLASPWFSTYAEAATTLRAALGSDIRLQVRTHRANVEGQRFCRTLPDDMEPAFDGSIREFVDRSDLVAVLGGTRTQYEAVLAGKPVLLLSRSLLSRAGVAYEFDGTNLSSIVRSALAREDWASRVEAGTRFLSFLGHHLLYGYGPAPIPRRATDLAAFLKRFVVPGSSVSPVHEHIDRFLKRTAPLLAAYVCDELVRGIRTMAPDYEPYVEAQMVAGLLHAGVVSAAVCGADPSTRRLITALTAAGILVTAILEPDPAMHGTVVEGIAVTGLDGLRWSGPCAVVIASHEHEHKRRAWLAANLPAGVRVVGPGDSWAASSSLAQCRLAIRARERGESATTVADLMERALAATPVPVEVVVEAGFALFDAGRLDGAERAAREATRARPAWSLPWHLLALCARARDLATADVARLLERALTFEPVLPELRFDAARALLDLGEIDRAFDLADQAVNQAPKWPEARELRDRLGSLKTSRCLETTV